MASPRPAPWPRAAVFTSLTGALAVVGHVAAGADSPSPAVLAGCLGLVLGCARLGASKERGWRVLLAATLGVQLGLHLLFALAEAFGRPVSWNVDGLLLCHQQPLPAVPPPGVAPLHLMGPAPQTLLVGALAMLVAHLVAAVLLAGWLRHGEALAWRLALSASLRLESAWRSRTASPRLVAPTLSNQPSAEHRPLRGAVLVRTQRGRGPPVLGTA